MPAPDWWIPSHGIMLALLLGFALAHSGLAALRPRGERWLGARLYRVVFAAVSLPGALAAIAYFIRHRYDGAQLWQLQEVPGMEPLVWGLSAVSFLFLYPATFNLAEVAAIQRPQEHFYATGVARITRHPQMVGQTLWCIAHTLWIGTSFAVVTSLGLIAHHLFGVWHGDRRWEQRHGDAFRAVKAQTSIVPFAAIADGRQQLRWREFLRPAYGVVLAVVWGIWQAHPALVQAAAQLPW
jgi:uncharacterized membrane protein